MIKVDCESCKAPYDLDERRLPPTGMKMRCPKCGSSFHVNRDGTTAPAEGGNAPTVKGTAVGAAAPVMPSVPKPAGVPVAPPPTDKGVRKATMLGMPVVNDGASAADVTKPRPPSGVMPMGAWGAKKPADSPAVPPPRPAGAFGAAPKIPAPSAFNKPPAPAGAAAPPPPAAFAPPPAAELDEAVITRPASADGLADLAAGSVSRPSSTFDEIDLPAPKRQPTPAHTSARAPLAGGKAPTLVGNPMATDASFDEVDLPAPAAKKPQAVFGNIDLDADANAQAPAVGFDEIDLPAPAGRKAPADRFRDLDLDAPVSTATGFDEVDLPAPVQKKGGAGFGEIDFDAGDAAPSSDSFDGIDLPAPAGNKTGAAFGDIDLPAPVVPRAPQSSEASFGDIDLGDLPAPRKPAATTDDESSFGDLNLDTGEGSVDLPAPKVVADLPAPKMLADLPAPKSLVDLPVAKGRADLPVAKAAAAAESEMSFADLQLDDEPARPPARTAPAAAPARPAITDDDFTLESERPGPSPEDVRRSLAGAPGALAGIGGIGSMGGADDDDVGGEMDLSGGAHADAADGAGGESGEEMEFGLPGRDGEASFTLPEDILQRQRGEKPAKRKATVEVDPRTRRLRFLMAFGVLMGMFAATGAALSLTNYGLFGMYYLERYLPAAGDPKAVAAAIERAEKAAATDTYEDVRRGLSILGRERKRAGINRELLTRSVVHEALYVMRFGQDPESASRAAAIMSRLEERRFDAPAMELAFAGDLAQRGEWARMAPHLAAARAERPSDPYVELMAGEVALHLEKPTEALKAFTRANELGGGARALWGLARVALLGSDVAAQDAAMEQTLAASPLHVGARIGKARVLIARNDEAAAIGMLEQAVGAATVNEKFLWSSAAEKADGYSVLGYVHEVRARLHLARKAYGDALGGDPYRLEALLGAGRVSLRDKRYTEALTRFESAKKVANTRDVTVLGGRKASTEAELGIARGLLATGRPQDAKEKLVKLMEKHPADAEIVLWVGKVEQELGRPHEAEELFRKSMELTPTKFDAYLALAQLFFNLGKPDDANVVLKDAAKKVHETSEMRRLLGQSELQRNQLESAITEFQRALTLDAGDMDALFGMGVALRRHGRLEVAEQVFNRLGKQDPSYAGLSLERGLLFEARGNFDGAAKAYQEALKQDPENSNLLLRLGAAEVALGDIDAAERTLEIVVRAMPNSAEAEYFIGRVAFARGQIAESMTHFDRALSLDGTVGEYRLYAGWAAMEMGNLGRTLEEIQAAITADPSLGDAFWLRGLIRLRTGAVQDALMDAKHALELKPSRTEALTVLGDCYDQLRMLDRAIDSYEKALRADNKRGHWWYRLGRLQMDAGRPSEASRSLDHATRIGDEESRTPAWLADAHRLRGEALETMGSQRGAIPHYKRYLELAESGAIDRRDVTKKLTRWGVELPSKKIY